MKPHVRHWMSALEYVDGVGERRGGSTVMAQQKLVLLISSGYAASQHSTCSVFAPNVKYNSHPLLSLCLFLVWCCRLHPSVAV